MHRWIHSAAGGTNQRLNVGPATVCSLSSHPAIADPPCCFYETGPVVRVPVAAWGAAQSYRHRSYLQYGRVMYHASTARHLWNIGISVHIPGSDHLPKDLGGCAWRCARATVRQPRRRRLSEAHTVAPDLGRACD